MPGEVKNFGGSLLMVSRAYQEYTVNRNLIAKLQTKFKIILAYAGLIYQTSKSSALGVDLIYVCKPVKRSKTPSLTQHAGTRLSKNLYLSRDL